MLETLFIGFNQIPSLNSSLLPLRSLKELNLTHNELREFSLQDIRGLKQLRIVDLSHNKISKLGGRMEVSKKNCSNHLRITNTDSWAVIII